jgi:hypothetical protein
MGSRHDEIIPSWVIRYFVVFPPTAFLLAFLFCLGCFFEIDHRLILILSFADFLLYFLIFVTLGSVCLFGLFGIGVLLVRWCGLERRVSMLLNNDYFSVRTTVTLIGVALAWGIFIHDGAVTLPAYVLAIVLSVARVPIIYRHDDFPRLTRAVVLAFIVLALAVVHFGTVAGQVLISASKRIYLIKLQGETDIYANILLHTSAGVIFRLHKEIYFAPHEAIVFIRRTGMRRESL